VANGFLDPEPMFFSSEVSFIFILNLNSQNNRYWCSRSPHAIPEVLMYEFRSQEPGVQGISTKSEGPSLSKKP
jgi:hypothetical protein